MKILIKTASAKMGGAVTYITHFLPHASRLFPDVEFVVILPPETISKVGKVGGNVRLVPTQITHAGRLRRIWWEQVTLRRLLVKEKVDVLYATGNFGMFWCPARQLLLVENLTSFSKTYRERYLPSLSLKERIENCLRRMLGLLSIRHADVVVTPTQAMLDDVLRAIQLPAERTLVNHYGIDLPEAAPEPHGADAGEDVRRNRGIVRMIYVSLYCSYKNITTVLKSLPLLNSGAERKFIFSTPADPSTPLPGQEDTEKVDISLAQHPDVRKYVEFTGYLGWEEVQNLYRSADLCLFPSVVESFGFPMLEAMAHGLPAVAADTPLSREVLGTAAVYFSPFDPEDLARQVRRLLDDELLYTRLSAEGRERVATKFRWEDHVARLLGAC